MKWKYLRVCVWERREEGNVIVDINEFNEIFRKTGTCLRVFSRVLREILAHWQSNRFITFEFGPEKQEEVPS